MPSVSLVVRKWQKLLSIEKSLKNLLQFKTWIFLPKSFIHINIMKIQNLLQYHLINFKLRLFISLKHTLFALL